MIRWTAWSTVAALLLALAREARAEEPSPEMLMQHTPRVLLAVKLSYTRGKGAERCPDDEGVRWWVLVHSDYDPFEQRPDRYPAGVLRLVVTGASNRLTGTYTYVDEKGQTWSTLSRTFSGTGQLECYWLLDFLAAGISVDFIVRESLLAMRLERATKPKPKPEPVEPPVCSAPLPCADSRYSIWPSEWPMPPLEKPKPDPPKPPEKAPLAFRFGPGVWVDRISDDRASVGLTLNASVRYLWGSVGVELRGTSGATGPALTAANPSALLAPGGDR